MITTKSAMASALGRTYAVIAHNQVGSIGSQGEVIKVRELPDEKTARRLFRIGAIEPLYNDEGAERYKATQAARLSATVVSGEDDDLLDDEEDDEFSDELDDDDDAPLTLGSNKPVDGEPVKPIEAREDYDGIGAPPEKTTGNNAVPGDPTPPAGFTPDPPADTNPPTNDGEFEGKSLEELRNEAKAFGIDGADKMNGKTVIAAIRRAQS